MAHIPKLDVAGSTPVSRSIFNNLATVLECRSGLNGITAKNSLRNTIDSKDAAWVGQAGTRSELRTRKVHWMACTTWRTCRWTKSRGRCATIWMQGLRKTCAALGSRLSYID